MIAGRIVAGLTLPFTAFPALAAQADPQDGESLRPDEGRIVIDISEAVDAQNRDALLEQRCAEETEAATISGEIIVCRQLGEDNSNYFSGSRENARKRYAEETKNYGTLPTPDFILDCHDQGYPFGCVGLGQPPPPALIIDVEALPEAPPGSDADRIARGLPPLDD